MILVEFQEKIKSNIKKAKHRFCILDVENLIQRQRSSLFNYPKTSIVKILFLENYCCHKIIQKKLLIFHEHDEIREVQSLLRVMFRNVQILFRFFRSFVKDKQILFMPQKGKVNNDVNARDSKTKQYSFEDSLKQNFIDHKDFCKFIQSVLMLSKNLAFYYGFYNKINLKIQILGGTIALLENASTYFNSFPLKTKKHRALLVQIYFMYSVTISKKYNFKQSLSTMEKTLNQILSHISLFQRKGGTQILQIKEPKTSKKNQKDKRNKTSEERYLEGKKQIVPKLIQKYYKIFLLSVIQMFICQIHVQSYSSLHYLWGVLIYLQKIPTSKKMLKIYTVYQSIKAYLYAIITCHKQFCASLPIIIDPQNKINLLIENDRNQFKKEECEEQNREQINDKKRTFETQLQLQKPFKLIIDAYDSIKDQTSLQNSQKVEEQTRTSNMRSEHKRNQTLRCRTYNSKPTKTNFSYTKSVHIRQRHGKKFKTFVCKDIITENKLNKIKKDLFLKNNYIKMQDKLLKEESYSQYLAQNEQSRDTYPSYTLNLSQKILNKSSKQKIMFNKKQTKSIYKVNNVQKKINKFYELLILNKHNLGIPQFCNKVDLHMKRQDERQKFNKFQNDSRCQNQRNEGDRGIPQSALNKPVVSSIFSKSLKSFKRQNSAVETSDIHMGDRKLSIYKYFSFKGHKVNDFQEQALPVDDLQKEKQKKQQEQLQKKRQICFKKSCQTINEIAKKINNHQRQSHKKITRKSNTLYKANINNNNFI